MNWRKEVLTGAHWHIKCALVKTPRLFFSSSTFSASESLPKKENRNKWTKTLLSQLLEKHPLHDVRWLWCTWQQLDIIVTTPISHAARVTKASWCYLWKEQNLLHFLTINWCIRLVRQWLAGGWAAGLLAPSHCTSIACVLWESRVLAVVPTRVLLLWTAAENERYFHATLWASCLLMFLFSTMT